MRGWFFFSALSIWSSAEKQYFKHCMPEAVKEPPLQACNNHIWEENNVEDALSRSTNQVYMSCWLPDKIATDITRLLTLRDILLYFLSWMKRFQRLEHENFSSALSSFCRDRAVGMLFCANLQLWADLLHSFTVKSAYSSFFPLFS